MWPYLAWMLDSTGKMTVNDVVRPENQGVFRPLNMKHLPLESGTVWLRFTMAGRPAEVRPATLLLDMGEGVPGTPTLYAPRYNVITGATEWQSLTPSQRSIFLMPEARNEPQTAYIRLDGLPGLWFTPMLRTPHNAATALERLVRPGVIVALAVIMLLCLLRGLTERGEWRIWTSAYTGAALCHAVWGIPPTAQGHVLMTHVGALLAPGVALMLLPHVGRHLMCTRTLSRALDMQYLLLALPGALLALLPLMPGYAWTTRFLELWPAGVIILLPTTLGAWLSGLPGARRFLLGCLLPPLGVAVACFGTGLDIPSPFLATAPLWGVALGALIVAGTAAPREYAIDQARAPLNDHSEDALLDNDPNLRIVSQDDLACEVARTSEGTREGILPCAEARMLAMEEQLRAPLDALRRDGTALENCSLPPAARQLCESILATVRSMTGTLTTPLPMEGGGASQVFDLQEVMRQAHDAVSSAADTRNIALSWFMPPHLPQRYRGCANPLRHVLHMLLESAVRATSRGGVQLTVRRVPESVNPGHLLFSVIDTGTGVPPEERSSLALVRAWEMVGSQRGFLGVESSPHGVSISFTLHLDVVAMDAPEDAITASPTLDILLADDSAGNRQLLAFLLEGLPYTVAEARDAREVLTILKRQPARLIIFDADMPGLETAVLEIRDVEREQGLPQTLLLVLSSDDGPGEALKAAGFSHTLVKPVTRAGLRHIVDQLLPTPKADMPEMASIPGMHAPMPSVPSSTFLLPECETLPHLPLSSRQEAPLTSVREGLLPHDNDADIIDTGMPLPVLESELPLSMEIPTATVSSETMPLPLPDILSLYTAHTELHDTDTHDTPATSPVSSHADYLTSLLSMDEPVRPQPVSPQLTVAPRPVSDEGEWVGEPMPLGTPLSTERQAATPASAPAPPATAPWHALDMGHSVESVEWVGEPVPVPKVQPVPVALPPVVEAPFIPLSFGPEPEFSDPAPAAPPPGQGTEYLRPNLLPQSSSLLDFIITEPIYAKVGEPIIDRLLPVTDAEMPLEHLLEDMDQSTLRARHALHSGDAEGVGMAARHIASQADRFGLRALARMARCVEDAAKAQDTEALGNLLPELELFVERNRIAMRGS